MSTLPPNDDQRHHTLLQMSDVPQAAVIMAAGKGTRMRSKITKILHKIAGLSIIEHVVKVTLEAGIQKIVIILGHQADQVRQHLSERFPDIPLEWAFQEEQLGTAHAVMCAQSALSNFQGAVWILSGDVPTLSVKTFTQLHEHCTHTSVAVAGMYLDDPKSYGRLLQDEEGLYAIREARDCTSEEYLTHEVNAGFYCVDAEVLFAALKSFKSDNSQGEYYLTDIVSYARKQGLQVGCHIFQGEAAEALEGVNDRVDLAQAESRIQRQLTLKAMRAGVTFIDPTRVYLHASVDLSSDVVIEPDVMLLGETFIESNVLIEQGCRIQDSKIQAGAHLKAYSHLARVDVGPFAEVGPFARLREGTQLGERVKVGNFVETKKTTLHMGAKASHLSYLGDAEIGAGANIGAGTITCNYDGYFKHKTQIGARAFIGSDTQLVAPVSIGQGAFVAAGSTITHNVPADALVLTRSALIEKEGWAKQYHHIQRLKKEAKKRG